MTEVYHICALHCSLIASRRFNFKLHVRNPYREPTIKLVKLQKTCACF